MRWLILLVLVLVGLGWVPAAEPTAQWLVVTPPAYRQALQPLLEARQAQRLAARMIVTTDVTGSMLEHLRAQYGQRPSYVLLVGDTATIPAPPGTHGRMRGQPSDFAYACRTNGAAPSVAVGRFPAQNLTEVQAFVEKTLAFEQTRLEDWHSKLTLLVGHPGGNSAVEKRFAEWFVTQAAGAGFAQLHPRWRGLALIHAPASPFCVPDAELRPMALRLLRAQQLFAFYLGHSDASGFWSGDAPFVSRKDWSELTMTGVFFSCGCFGTQLAGKDGEGYGLAAIRNPQGPVAVIGATGESYGAFGQLALDGLTRLLNQPVVPTRLAEYWQATQTGLLTGKLDPVTFWLYDQADGSRGQVPLADQRPEHAEMWLLLGDPALRMPIPPPTITLTATVGEQLTVIGTYPAQFQAAFVKLTVERPVGTPPPGPVGVPSLASYQRALNSVLVAVQIPTATESFTTQIKLPAEAKGQRLVVRAEAGPARGAVSVGK